MCGRDAVRIGRLAVAGAAIFACLLTVSVAEAQRGRRGPSPQQIQKMREQMQYQQQEMMRVQSEMAAKEKEIQAKFDENGDGKLFGTEKSKYESHMRDIRFGRVPNPFADIKPPGQGPRPGKK